LILETLFYFSGFLGIFSRSFSDYCSDFFNSFLLTFGQKKNLFEFNGEIGRGRFDIKKNGTFKTRVMLTGAPEPLVKEPKKENFKIKITFFMF